MKRVVSATVAALTCAGLLAACGTESECVSIPAKIIDAIKSGNPGTTTFGNYGGVETTIADRRAYIVAVELESKYSDNNLTPGVWRVGYSGTSSGPLLAANDMAAAVAEWPRDRDEDKHLVSDAESCIEA